MAKGPNEKRERGLTLDQRALVYAMKVKNNINRDQLAARTQLSSSTIDRALQGKPIAPDSAHAIATALGGIPLIDLMTYMADAPESPPQGERDPKIAPPVPCSKVRFIIEVDGDYSEPLILHAQRLMAVASKLAKLVEHYDDSNLDPKQGSLIFKVSLSHDDAALFIDAYAQGMLDELPIKMITVDPARFDDRVTFDAFIAAGAIVAEELRRSDILNGLIKHTRTLLVDDANTNCDDIVRLFVSGLSYDEIARALSIPSDTVRHRLMHIIRALENTPQQPAILAEQSGVSSPGPRAE